MIFKHYTGPNRVIPPLHWARLDEQEAETEAFMQQWKSPPGHAVAIVTCKNGHACMLRVPPFTVSLAGTVMPSVACPVAGCDGHEPPGSTLEGWEG